MPRGEFKHHYWFFADTQISLEIIALFEKINDGKPILMMWKVWRSRTLCHYWETIIDLKWQKQGLLSSFKPLTRWGLQRFFWKF